MSYVNPIWAEEQRKRWLRPDWERWMRPDWRRWARGDEHCFPPPAVPEEKSQHSDTDFAEELDAIRAEHARVRQMLAEVKYDLAWRRIIRKYSPDQPRVPAGNPDGGRWTDGGGSGATKQPAAMTTQPARLLRPFRPGPTLPSIPIPALPDIAASPMSPAVALATYNQLSNRNTDDSRAVLTFNAHAFEPNADPNKPAIGIDRLTRDQVDQVCPRYIEVQSITDQAARTIDRAAYPSSASYGTAVHMWIKAEVNGSETGPPKNPAFRSEVSFIKSEYADYGDPGSKRVDVFENPGNGTVCIYDIKTGNAVLSFSRMQELATAVGTYYPGTRQIVVTEVKPRQW
jgi:hypothetical protein